MTTGLAHATPVTVGNAEVEISARVDAVYYDDGLKKNLDYEPAKVTNVYERVLKLGLKADPSPATTFHFVADPTQEDPVERALVTWHGSAVVIVEAGINYVNVGGWEQRTWDYETVLVSPYVKTLMPWIKADDSNTRTGPASAPAVAVTANLAGIGAFTFQAVDDVVFGEDRAASFAKSHNQLALLAQFVGSGETVKPLLQLGTYDINHSLLAAVGVAVEQGQFVAHVDYMIDRRNRRPSDDRGNVTEYRSAAVDGAVRWNETELFAKVALLDVKQPGGRYGTDHVGNSPGVVFDDNALDYALGLRYKLDGDVFKPYVAIVRHTGRFLRDVDEPRGTVDDKQDLAVQVGVSSHF